MRRIATQLAMPVSLAVDLCWRVVWFKIVHDMSTAAIARQMRISEHSVRQYLSLFRRAGDVRPKIQRHAPQRRL